jgi:hypothetical protein
MTPIHNSYITLAEASALVGSSRISLARAARRGTLRATQLGYQWFTTKDAVEYWAANKNRKNTTEQENSK